VSGRLTYLGFLVGWTVLRWLPERVAVVAFAAGARLTWRRQGRGTRRLRANLAQVVGPGVDAAALDRLTQRALQSYARYWLETFRLPVMTAERIVGGARVRGREHLDVALAAGRGVVVALPHMGNWDHAGAWAVLEGMPATTVAERLEPVRLFDRFVAYRERLGIEVLPLTGGAEPPFAVLADRLRAGRLVCLLGDRDLSARGVAVSFFGRRAKLPAGPALLALRTGAPLLPAVLWFEDHGWGIEIGPPLEPPAGGGDVERVAGLTQALADAFARGIAAHPEDWHMLQRCWLDDESPARRAEHPVVDLAAADDPR